MLKYNERMHDVSPGDLLCIIVSDYKKFLTDTLDSTNEHAKLIVNFLLVSGDFLDFVSAYRNQDSIMVEVGYKMFAPIWKLLGQNKYLEATWEQMDVLYHNFRYSQLQEVRINRQVRTYPGKSGKSALAQDEWLELNNKEFSNYPTVRTLNSMTRQGNYIGMTKRCKRFLEVVYSPGDLTKRVIYQSGTGAKGHGQSERRLLWEIVDLFLCDFVPSLTNDKNV